MTITAPRPAAVAREWVRDLDDVLEGLGDVTEAELSAAIVEHLDKLERRGAISAAEAAALAALFEPA